MRPFAFRGSNLTSPARARLVRWLVANGVEANRIPLESVVVVTGNRIHCREVIYDQRRRGGVNRRMTLDRDGDWSIETRPRTYRIRINLEDVA